MIKPATNLVAKNMNYVKLDGICTGKAILSGKFHKLKKMYRDNQSEAPIMKSVRETLSKRRVKEEPARV